LCDLFEKTDSSDSSVAALLNLRRIGKDGATAEGNRIFENTETEKTWCLYGDGLIQFWTKRNIAHCKSIGLRLWTAESDTNCNNRYKGKVTGNSPEVNVGTDNDGFRDFGASMAFHVGLSLLYEVGDPRRMSLGTMHAADSTMRK